MTYRRAGVRLTEVGASRRRQTDLRRTDRLHVGLVQDDASLGQGVDVGCDHVRIVEANIVPPCRGRQTFSLKFAVDCYVL